jgi:hypothetical protein
MAQLLGTTGGEQPVLLLGNLDFSDIKDSLIEHMKESEVFADYDFSGSALSTLMDLLAYNSTLYTYYANMIANESFLDTAIKQESIASLVKPLSYTPFSRRSAEATVVVSGTGQTIQMGDPFTGGGYNWTPKREYYINGNTEITLIQGNKIDSTSNDLIDSQVVHQRFPIGRTEIDTTTLEVFVDEGRGWNKWTKIDNLVGNVAGVTAGDKIYYLSSSHMGGYEVYFGDNVVGKKPIHMSAVRMEYIVTAGEEANQVADFSTPMTGVGIVSTTKASVGGSNAEALETIRKNAPSFYQTQGRAVTAKDYESFVKQQLVGIVSNVWGGEDNFPTPHYGRVFVTAVSTNRQMLSSDQKTEIIDFMKTKAVVSIIPEFVDPVPIDIMISGLINYNALDLETTEDELGNKITSYIETFPLGVFEEVFDYGLFSSRILALDPSILGLSLSVWLQQIKEASPNNKLFAFEIPFRNKLKESGGLPGTVLETNRFLVEEGGQLTNVYLIDDGIGLVQMRREGGNNPDSIVRNVGTIDYINGIIHVDGVVIVSDIEVRVAPFSNVVRASGPLMLTLKEQGIELRSV